MENPPAGGTSQPGIRAATVEPSPRERLEYLRSTLAGPGADASVEVIETHLSWVVLGRDRVLKMKKPVQSPLVDFSSVAARERNAHEEVRLNRRLALDVYLGVLALQWLGGDFALVPAEVLPAPGTTVDWLVHMRRLPGALMLDRLAVQRDLHFSQVDALAATLAAFHAAAPRVALRPSDYLQRIAHEQRLNGTVLLDPRVGLPEASAVLARFDLVLCDSAGLLSRRAQDGRIIEGHGDLRPEHVCMLQPPVVIDCLEFDATLREVDPFDELAFLGLECTLLGASWIGRRMWARCAERLGDPAGEPLRLVHTAQRALIRARLMAAHVLDAEVCAPATWQARARRYLNAATASMMRLDQIPRE